MPSIQNANSIVRDTRTLLARILIPLGQRVCLRLIPQDEGVIPKEKPESRNGLAVPLLLGTDFTHIQALLNSNHSVDGSI